MLDQLSLALSLCLLISKMGEIASPLQKQYRAHVCMTFYTLAWDYFSPIFLKLKHKARLFKSKQMPWPILLLLSKMWSNSHNDKRGFPCDHFGVLGKILLFSSPEITAQHGKDGHPQEQQVQSLITRHHGNIQVSQLKSLQTVLFHSH